MKNLLIALALVALIACGNKPAAAPPVETKKQEEKKKAETSSDCTRGEPTALMASASDFKSISPQEAREIIPIEAGMTLQVKHFGCTHYALEFEFTWVGGKLPEPKVSLAKAADILDGLQVKEQNQGVRKTISAGLLKMAAEPYKQPLTLSETENLTATTPTPNTLVVRYDVAL